MNASEHDRAEGAAVAAATAAVPARCRDDPTCAPAEIASRIEAVHHRRARRWLSHLDGLVARRVARIGPSRAAQALDTHFVGWSLEVQEHLNREEHDWFPAIRAEAGGCAEALGRTLHAQHERIVTGLTALQREARALATRGDPQALHARLAMALDAFAQELRVHAWLEDEVLLPRVRAAQHSPDCVGPDVCADSAATRGRRGVRRWTSSR